MIKIFVVNILKYTIGLPVMVFLTVFIVAVGLILLPILSAINHFEFYYDRKWDHGDYVSSGFLSTIVDIWTPWR